jgi:F-type H+-transporting ATPase subunit delta
VAVVRRIYARALYEAAKDRGRVDDVREELADFAEATRDVPELRELLRNPQLDPRTRANVLEHVLGAADELLRNFVLLLVDKGRSGDLGEIEREFERIVESEEGVVRVELTTAYELSDEEARELIGQIERASGRPVEATRSVDPSLIGGVVLQVGSHRLDASVRGRLERLRRELVTS